MAIAVVVSGQYYLNYDNLSPEQHKILAGSYHYLWPEVQDS